MKSLTHPVRIHPNLLATLQRVYLAKNKVSNYNNKLKY